MDFCIAKTKYFKTLTLFSCALLKHDFRSVSYENSNTVRSQMCCFTQRGCLFHEFPYPYFTMFSLSQVPGYYLRFICLLCIPLLFVLLFAPLTFSHLFYQHFAFASLRFAASVILLWPLQPAHLRFLFAAKISKIKVNPSNRAFLLLMPLSLWSRTVSEEKDGPIIANWAAFCAVTAIFGFP